MNQLHYGIYQPLRFYEKLEHQDRFKLGANLSSFRLMYPNRYIPSFQIKRDTSTTAPVTSVKLINVRTGIKTEIITAFFPDEIEVFAFSNFDYIVHFGEKQISHVYDDGLYYLEVSDVSNTWYSEVIDFITFDPDLLDSECVKSKIVYYDTCDVGNILYRTGNKQYKNTLYLDVDIGKPTYSFEEEGDEDSLGNFIPELKRTEKEYLLQRPFPEYIVDALSLIPLHISKTGKVEISTDRNYVSEVHIFSMEIDWPEKFGVLALTDLRFSTSYTTKTNCCDDLEELLTDCLRSYTNAVALIQENTPEHQGRYYNDLSNNGAITNFQDGDLILLQLVPSAQLVLRQYSQSQNAYINAPIILNKGDAIYDNNFRNSGFQSPIFRYYYSGNTIDNIQSRIKITSVSLDLVNTEYILQGRGFQEAYYTIFGRDSKGNITLLGSFSGNAFNGTGYRFNPGAAIKSVKVIAKGFNCTLDETAWFTLPSGLYGIGSGGGGVIGGGFQVGA